MKVSVSLPADDVGFLDEFAKSRGYASRSAVVRKAVRLLRSSELGGDYETAWDDWAESGNADSWDATTGDHLT